MLSILPITYFFLVCLPGITQPGWSALLPAAPLNSECRGRGGRARLSCPPPGPRLQLQSQTALF
jgi:hypothetical protein